MNGKLTPKVSVSPTTRWMNIEQNTELTFDYHWEYYDIIVGQAQFYGNVTAQIMCHKAYFSQTSFGQRPYISDYEKVLIEFWQGGPGKIVVKSYYTKADAYGFGIWGIKFLV